MPNYNRVWASSAQAPDDIAEPDAGAVESGHGTVSPPRHNWENWLKNQIVKGLQQLQREAALNYNAAVPYGRGVTVRYESDSYLSLEDDNQGNQPDVSPSVWRKLPEGGVGVFADNVAGLDERPGIYLQEVVAETPNETRASSSVPVNTDLVATITPRRIGSVIEAIAYAPATSILSLPGGLSRNILVGYLQLRNETQQVTSENFYYGHRLESDPVAGTELTYSPVVHHRFNVSSLSAQTIRLRIGTQSSGSEIRCGVSASHHSPLTLILREIAQ